MATLFEQAKRALVKTKTPDQKLPVPKGNVIKPYYQEGGANAALQFQIKTDGVGLRVDAGTIGLKEDPQKKLAAGQHKILELNAQVLRGTVLVGQNLGLTSQFRRAGAQYAEHEFRVATLDGGEALIPGPVFEPEFNQRNWRVGGDIAVQTNGPRVDLTLFKSTRGDQETSCAFKLSLDAFQNTGASLSLSIGSQRTRIGARAGQALSYKDSDGNTVVSIT